MMMKMFSRVCVLLLLLLLIVGGSDCLSVTTSPGGTRSSSSSSTAMREWLLNNNRFETSAVELLPSSSTAEPGKTIAVTTTRNVARGDILFKLTSNSIWTPLQAYKDDHDIGPQLYDLHQKIGPGFGVVALTGVLAAERIRRYRKIVGQELAPEANGYSIPSKWGVLARCLWENDNDSINNIDESIMGTVQQGVNLLVPLLDVVSRRAWSSAAADDDTPPPKFLSEEWARKAMYDDGSATSWSRGEIENLAIKSFGIVLNKQKSPAPYLLSGEFGSLIPEPYLADTSPEIWSESDGEPLALVPLVDDLLMPVDNENEVSANAVLGSPPRGTGVGSEKDAQKMVDCDSIWCVASRDLQVGEQVIVSNNPW